MVWYEILMQCYIYMYLIVLEKNEGLIDIQNRIPMQCFKHFEVN